MASVHPGSWRHELSDFLRGLSGAFLLGVPLLYTMEMWWLGTFTEPLRLLLLLGIALAANFGLAYFAGFRSSSATGNFEEAVEAVAVGVVASLVVLFTLNRISLGDPLRSIVGQVVVQALPLSIGVSVANAIFFSGRTRQGEEQSAPPSGAVRATLQDIGATAVGGVLVGFSIAPTDEVPMLAAGLDLPHQLALIGLSLLLTYAIVFVSGFDPEQYQSRPTGFLQTPVSETAMAYLVSLLVAATGLVLLNQAAFTDPPEHLLSQVLVLGLPTAIGGAAGRLVI